MLAVRDLSKNFEGVTALNGFSAEVARGEIVGIIGENGAGKSTLMKLISGIHSPTRGEVCVDGVSKHFRTPGEAIRAGISMVHQELNLIPTLSAAENIFLGREFGSLGAIDRRRMAAETQRLLDRVGAKFSPDTLCEDLSIAEQQLVEIAKALSYQARLVIFDEPTAVLSSVEADRLEALIRELKAQGISVLYVTHRLHEVIRLCDRIIVLRDGEQVSEFDPALTNESELANSMVGRELQEIFPAKREPSSNALLNVQLITNSSGAGGKSEGELGSFVVHAGEIVGVAGLIGAGRTEMCEGVVGLRRMSFGSISVGNQLVSIPNYRRAIGHRLAYVSEDRKGKVLVTTMSVRDNLLLATLDHPSDPKVWVEALSIKVNDLQQPISTLSGGNQQKVSIARWLATKPEVLFLDEPTRGVDVGAKAGIYQIIAGLARDGLGCVVVSSEMPELIGLCHRIVVMRGGRLVGELDGPNMTESKIMMLAAGVAA